MCSDMNIYTISSSSEVVFLPPWTNISQYTHLTLLITLETRTHNAWRRFATFSGWNCHFRHDDCVVLSAWHDESLRSLLLSAWSRMCLFPIPAPGHPSGNAYVGPQDCLNWPTMLEHTDKTAALAGANASACPQTVWGHMFCPHEGNILDMIPVKSLCCQSQQAPLSWYMCFTLGSECSGSRWFGYYYNFLII